LIDERDNPRQPPRAGGSCGNVMAILSFLGWTSYPIVSFRNDKSSTIIREDLSRWGVRTDFFETGKAAAPIVIERLTNCGRTNTHVFEFTCQKCGQPLPRNRPVPGEFVRAIKEKLPHAQVFYFDRVSKSSLELAEAMKSNGATIVFEPCRLSREDLFRECLDIVDVLKYSVRQLHIPRDLVSRSGLHLEIQTMGAEGLRYRTAKARNGAAWTRVPPYSAPNFVDAAGSGDWCTAGILHLLCQSGSGELVDSSQSEVEYAMKFGQSLAAIGCAFDGARGLMYSIKKQDLECFAGKLLDDETDGFDFKGRSVEDMPSSHWRLNYGECLHLLANRGSVSKSEDQSLVQPVQRG
jgi:fructokinase